jgi:hypothetical protein
MDTDEIYLPGAVHLYSGARTDTLDLDEIAKFVRSILTKADVLVLEDVISGRLDELSGSQKEQELADLARAFAAARVHDISAQQDADSILYGEVEYEKRRILDTTMKSLGILYDGQTLTSIYAGAIGPDHLTVEIAHIVFTNQLVGTWDDNDKRYHARVAVYGYPSIISTAGVVEAPARPREFYLKRQMGVDPITLKEEFQGRFIDYDDPRLTEVMKGYVAQALFYHMTGEPFCQNKSCRLYNAHWQEDLIQAQLTGDDFCPEHAAFLSGLTT